MLEPPFESGGLHVNETFPLPAVATKFWGGDGAVNKAIGNKIPMIARITKKEVATDFSLTCIVVKLISLPLHLFGSDLIPYHCA